jgi:hypothetical protein
MDKITEPRFKKWLAQQPDDRIFCYVNTEGCLIASFLRETGFAPDASCGSSYWSSGKQGGGSFPPWLRQISAIAVVKMDCQFTVAQFRDAYLK